MISFKLYQVEQPQDYKLKLIPPELPRPPFRMVLQGPSGSGKSSFIKNVLFNSQWGYNKYFSEIYCFIGSLDDVAELKQLSAHYQMEHIAIFQKYDDEHVLKLFESIETDNQKKKQKARVLFIFDDQICNQVSSRCKLNALDTLAIRGRHANCSYIVSTQKYKSLNNNIRTLNCTDLAVFSGTAQTDLDSIADEHAAAMSKDDLLKMFKIYLDKKFQFVMIDNRNHVVRDKNFAPLAV